LTLPGLELQPLGHPARSQSLYRLRYPASTTILRIHFYYFGPCLSSEFSKPFRKLVPFPSSFHQARARSVRYSFVSCDIEGGNGTNFRSALDFINLGNKQNKSFKEVSHHCQEAVNLDYVACLLSVLIHAVLRNCVLNGLLF
jgi:hypothetical protein